MTKQNQKYFPRAEKYHKCNKCHIEVEIQVKNNKKINISLKFANKAPFVIHNLTRYGIHFIMQQIANFN